MRIETQNALEEILDGVDASGKTTTSKERYECALIAAHVLKAMTKDAMYQDVINDIREWLANH